MTTPSDLDYFLDLDSFIFRALEAEWATYSGEVEESFNSLVSAGKLAEAEELVSTLAPAGILAKSKASILAGFRATIDFGASQVSGKSLTSSLAFDRVLSAQVSQLENYLRYDFVAAMHRAMLQSIAQATTIKKAAALKPMVSFKTKGQALLQMAATLHASRLSGWGFVAEADLLGVTEYKLSAQIDNRTSAFCRAMHGRVFKVADASVLLDKAVYADTPQDLKLLHPWPKQDKASLEAYAKMSSQELTALNFHVPPFHPGCRTMMIATKTVSRIVKPAPVDQEVVFSEKEDFNAVGLKITPAELAVWNDYIQVKPYSLLHTFTGTELSKLVATAKSMLKVSSRGYVTIGNAAGSLRLATGTGRATTTYSSEQLLATWGRIEATANMMGTSSVSAMVDVGFAEAMLRIGFFPTATVWAAIQRKIAMVAKDINMSFADRKLVQSIATSTNPASLATLLELSPDTRSAVLGGLSFPSIKSFDATGLS